MKVFNTCHTTRRYHGLSDEYEFRIVVAATKSECLGLLLQEEKNTSASDWEIEEIPLTVSGVHELL